MAGRELLGGVASLACLPECLRTGGYRMAVRKLTHPQVYHKSERSWSKSAETVVRKDSYNVFYGTSWKGGIILGTTTSRSTGALAANAFFRDALIPSGSVLMPTAPKASASFTKSGLCRSVPM